LLNHIPIANSKTPDENLIDPSVGENKARINAILRGCGAANPTPKVHGIAQFLAPASDLIVADPRDDPTTMF
jgi:hypothetical protein